MKRLLLLLLLLGLPAVSVPALATAAPPADVKAVVDGNTGFACDLYGKLRAREGNLFFSPFSVSTALAMTSAGARGDTLKGMTRALHLPPQDELHPALGKLLRQVNGP